MFNYLEDENLSLSAKGLLAYMLSKPKNWYFTAQKLEIETNTKRLKLETALNELEYFGYLKRERCRENGRLGKMKFEVFDIPYKNIEQVGCGVGYVYLVKLDKNYKIGISKNPNQRLKEFTKLP